MCYRSYTHVQVCLHNEITSHHPAAGRWVRAKAEARAHCKEIFLEGNLASVLHILMTVQKNDSNNCSIDDHIATLSIFALM